MMLYRPVAWKEEEAHDFAFLPGYSDAMELGNEYFPSGFDIEEYDTDEEDFSWDLL